MLANQGGSSKETANQPVQKPVSTTETKQVTDAQAQEQAEGVVNPFVKAVQDQLSAVGKAMTTMQQNKEKQVQSAKTVGTVLGQYLNNASGKDYVLNTPGEVFMNSQMTLQNMEKQHGSFSNMPYEAQQRAMGYATAKNAAASLIRGGVDPTAEIDDLTSADAQTLRDLGFGTEAQTRYDVDISTPQSKEAKRAARSTSSSIDVDTSSIERNQVPLQQVDKSLGK